MHSGRRRPIRSHGQTLGALACAWLALLGCGLFGYERMKPSLGGDAGEVAGEDAGAIVPAPVCTGVYCSTGEDAGVTDAGAADAAAADAGGAVPEPLPPRCDDGIQNQDETAVDCGGSLCSACPTCSDGIQNQAETAVDCGGPLCSGCGVNTPPIARFTVSPGIGSHDGSPATVFTGDASSSSDVQQAAAALSYSWDWDNDGVEDATGITSTHSYGTAGTFDVRLTVQDGGGLRSSATFSVIVSSESSIVRVTTPADEDDNGATPGSPGNTGLSLREAMKYANTTAGLQRILVPAGFSIALTSELPGLTDSAGMDLIGDGAILDGSATGAFDDCLQIDTSQTRVFGLEIRNCHRNPLHVLVTTGDQFSRLDIHDNALPVSISGSGNIFGPYNVVRRSAGDGIALGGTTTVEWSEFHDNTGHGIDLGATADGSLLIGNIITGNDPGIYINSFSNSNIILHNTLHSNRSDGITDGTVVTGTTLRNNIFSSNVAYGLRADDVDFSANDHNQYSSNGLDTCSFCSSLGTGSLQSSVNFFDATGNDFRLRPGEPAIDAGLDTGNDVNGPQPGNGLFNGSAPDLGARESP